MKPKIEDTSFGSIVIAGEIFTKDIVITSEGLVRKRKKKLSKERYGTSHIISLDEAKDVYQSGIEWVIIGTGQSDLVRLSPEAEQYFDKHDCKVTLLVTPQAIAAWNDAKGPGVGLFHITC